jgi:geranylgeranyl pyrophosphate synthase
MYAQAAFLPDQAFIATPAVTTATFDALLSAVEQNLLRCIVSQEYWPPSAATSAIACHLRSGGQRVRARLAIHAGLKLQLVHGDIIALATTAELLHNASLIHDDLQDRDALRHGVASVWSAFGENTAICAGDLMLAAAYGALGAVSQPARLPALLKLTLARTGAAIGGQCLDLAGPKDQAIAGYEAMAMAKSGALLSLPTELALLAADRNDCLLGARQAAESFAIGYQIVDDIDDINIDADPLKMVPSFNILLLLQAGGKAEAHATAVQLAQQHFERAAIAAAQLPDGIGDLLTVLVQRLALRL